MSCPITAELLQTRDDGTPQPPPSLACSSRRKPEAAESSHRALDNSQKKSEMMINGVCSAGVAETESKVLSKQPGQRPQGKSAFGLPGYTCVRLRLPPGCAFLAVVISKPSAHGKLSVNHEKFLLQQNRF